MDRMEAMGGGLLVPWCVPNFENTFTTWDHPESPSPWHKVKTAPWTILEVINSALYFILQSEDYQNTQKNVENKEYNKKTTRPNHPAQGPNPPRLAAKKTRSSYTVEQFSDPPPERKESSTQKADESSTPKSKRAKKKKKTAHNQIEEENRRNMTKPDGPVPEYEMFE